jgi:hypothetical protein
MVVRKKKKKEKEASGGSGTVKRHYSLLERSGKEENSTVQLVTCQYWYKL